MAWRFISTFVYFSSLILHFFWNPVPGLTPTRTIHLSRLSHSKTSETVTSLFPLPISPRLDARSPLRPRSLARSVGTTTKCNEEERSDNTADGDGVCLLNYVPHFEASRTSLFGSPQSNAEMGNKTSRRAERTSWSWTTWIIGKGQAVETVLVDNHVGISTLFGTRTVPATNFQERHPRRKT